MPMFYKLKIGDRVKLKPRKWIEKNSFPKASSFTSNYRYEYRNSNPHLGNHIYEYEILTAKNRVFILTEIMNDEGLVKIKIDEKTVIVPVWALTKSR